MQKKILVIIVIGSIVCGVINNVSAFTGYIMVTGSHNPSEYNGFKFIVGRAPFFGNDIKKLGEISAKYDKNLKLTATHSKAINIKERLIWYGKYAPEQIST